MSGTPKRARRRWIWPVVAALGLSAVVQVGIVVMPYSWYTALWGRPVGTGSTQFTVCGNDLVWKVYQSDAGWTGDRIITETTNGVWLRAEAEAKDIQFVRDLFVPSWSMFAGASGAATMATVNDRLDPDWFTLRITELAEGWPWRCVRGESRRVRMWATQGRTVARTGLFRLDGHGWIPYLPIWPGLLLNLVVLALPWYAVFWVAGSGRRKYRRRRGRCGACGYDLAGLDRGTACPECGAVDSSA